MMRLEAAVRIDASCDTVRADVAGVGAGMRTVTLTHGLYYAAGLAAELQAALVALVDPAATVTVADGVYTIAWTGGASGEIEWTHPRLRDWLGFTGSSSTGTTSITGAQSPGVFAPSLPWTDPAPLSWRLELARSSTWRASGRSFLRALHRDWHCTLRATRAELPQLRRVLAEALAGSPLRWFRFVGTSTAWSQTNPGGYVDGWLSPEARTYVARWMSSPAELACEVDLQLAEYVA